MKTAGIAPGAILPWKNECETLQAYQTKFTDTVLKDMPKN